jgi:monoamine oxidase
MNGNVWTIDSTQVEVTPATRINGSVVLGSRVECELLVRGSALPLALSITVLAPPEATPVPVEFQDLIVAIETPWWTEEWTRGCSMAHLPPGMLTRHGSLLRKPEGRVHWAGTETATISHGAIDGAVRSGDRAATEILELSARRHA